MCTQKTTSITTVMVIHYYGYFSLWLPCTVMMWRKKAATTEATDLFFFLHKASTSQKEQNMERRRCDRQPFFLIIFSPSPEKH